MTTKSSNRTTRENNSKTFTELERDWRNGAIVYQVLVDRFAPSDRLDAKHALYPAPKVLRDWSEMPKKGPYLAESRLYSHEIDFWGGDFESLRKKLDYIVQLGTDVLYLNPIHLAYTNHKYDALDYQIISPEFGDRNEFISLAAETHSLGMKIVLDGVFNHMGRNASIFQDAFANPASPWRNWFAIGPQFEGGARSWTGAQNLPELNIENPVVQKYLYTDPDSVVRGYLREGADGWRLDTAFEIGYKYLRALTDAAHLEKKGSLVIGELENYPDEWLRSVDAVMNFTLRHIILGTVKGIILPVEAGRMINRMISDSGIEPMLKSWVLLDNHDLPRIATVLPEVAGRRLAQVLQFTLPGSPNIYYGGELGMTGGDDPENRGPMRWDLVSDENPEFVWIKKLISIHKEHRALRIGNFRLVESGRLLAFERYTDRALETVVVLVNPSGQTITDRIMVTNAGLMDNTSMVNILDPEGMPAVCEVQSGLMTVTIQPESAIVLMPHEYYQGGYSRYKRIP